MKILLKILNKIKSVENLIFKEEESLDSYTLIIKNFILEKKDLESLCAIKEHLLLSIETSDLYDFIEKPDDILSVLDDSDNYELKIHFKKKEYLKSLFQDKNIKLFISINKYLLEFKELVLNEVGLEGIIVEKGEYFYGETFIVTNINRNYKKDIQDFSTKNFKNQQIKIKKNCNWSNTKDDSIPENINIDVENTSFSINAKIEKDIIKRTVELIIKSIFNFTEIDNGILKSTLLGEKTLVVDFTAKDESYTRKAYKELYELYEWIYSNENTATDKLSVVRCVIGALIAAKWHKGCPNSPLDVILENVTWLEKSSKDNFQKVTEGNVKDYFKEKNNILELLKKDIGTVNDNILDMTKNITTNLTVGIGAIIAGSLGYVAKQDFAMVRIIFLIYAIYITINTILNLYLIKTKKKRTIESFDLKFDKYKLEYLEDDYLLNVKKEKDSNENIFRVYFWGSVIFVGIIDILSILTILSKDFLPWLFSIFK